MATWSEFHQQQVELPYYLALQQRLKEREQAGEVSYPPADDIFNAFTLTPLADVRVIILGQDPYHGPGQAHGLAFSVRPGENFPPSLRNIFKELQTEYPHMQLPLTGDLSGWAEQGVLLLNTVLTVAQAEPGSHADLGWQQYTRAALDYICAERSGLIFLAWGKHAQALVKQLDTTNQHVLKSVHPSPLSAHRGFFGCDHFRQVNTLLTQQGLQPIDWVGALI